ncbi:MAG: Ribonuclease Z [Chlamydiae bacterium]|nr:Ribonuclease Z [Chlamydiota bacterium]
MTVRDFIILGSSSQTPTRFRNHGAYLLRWNGEGFLFDPGEGTQRQFIYANVAPTCITRIFISHFHGDHCLGLGSMLMRLNLDKVSHTVHCYYPGRYKKFFDRLRYGTVYHDTLKVVEHPVFEEGIVEDSGKFKIEATFLEHGIENIGWRITESDQRKFDKEKLQALNIKGPHVRKLHEQGSLNVDGVEVSLDEVSWIRKGDSFVYAVDSRKCPQIVKLAKGAKLLVSEATYADCDKALAYDHHHMTARQAAQIAREAKAKKLILTHFSARYQSTHELLEEARAVFPNTEIAEDFKVFEFERD